MPIFPLMMRGVLIFGALMLVFLVGTWTQYLVRENKELTNKVHLLQQKLEQQTHDYSALYDDFLREESLARHGGETPQQSKDSLNQMLNAERAKLAELQKSLDGVTAGHGNQDANSYIAEDQNTIKMLQTELANVNNDGNAVNQRSKAYRDQTLDGLRQQRGAAATQLQGINAALQTTQAQLKAAQQMDKRDPNRASQIEFYKNQRDSLNQQKSTAQNQIRQLDMKMRSTDQAINNEVSSEQGEVAGDRQRLQTQLTAAKADLEKWRAVANSGASADTRRKSIAADIAAEKAKISSMEKMLQALGAH